MFQTCNMKKPVIKSKKIQNAHVSLLNVIDIILFLSIFSTGAINAYSKVMYSTYNYFVVIPYVLIEIKT